MTCAAFSNCEEGVHENVLFAGRSDGSIEVFSAYTWNLVARLRSPHQHPVLCIAMSTDKQRFASGDKDALVATWENRLLK